MNDPAQARRLVLISVFAMLGIAAYRGKLTSGDVGFLKRLWGVGVVAVMLGLLADVAPQIAGPFAVLIVVGQLTQGGDKALQNFLGKVSGTSAAPTVGTPPGVIVAQATHPGANP